MGLHTDENSGHGGDGAVDALRFRRCNQMRRILRGLDVRERDGVDAERDDGFGVQFGPGRVRLLETNERFVS